MPTSTTNYELIKPGTDDPILIEQLNTNADIIDNALKENADALGGKVDKETGKGLSTNDFTTAEKTKLAGIAEGAEVNEIESIKVNNTTINPDANKVVNITVPTTAVDVSALPDTTKYAVALSLTINSSTFVMTGQLKDQNGDNLGTAQTIDLPLESVVVGGSYNSQTKKVVLTLQNGNTIEFSVADLVSGLQTELSASNKLNPAYINYDSAHRAVSDTEKSTWNGKQNALTTSQLDAVNSGIDSTKVAQIETNENNILLLEQANGAKNQINIPDGTYTAGTSSYSVTNGAVTSTATDNTTHAVDLSIWALKAGTYVFYDDSSDLSAVQYRIYQQNPDTRLTPAGQNPATFTLANDTVVYLSCYTFKTGTMTTRPMLMTKAMWDAGFTDYQPYAMSNVELTNELTIEDITSSVTASTGYTLKTVHTHLYRQGKHVFGEIQIAKDSGYYSTTNSTVATIASAYMPKVQYLGCGCFGTGEWDVNAVGTAYIDNITGEIKVDTQSQNNNIVTLQISYVIN